MKNKKLLLSRVLALMIVVSVLISCFVISSSAAWSDIVHLPESYYTFIPRLSSASNTQYIFDAGFYAGSYPDSFRTISVYGDSERGTYFTFDPGGIPLDICHISPDGVLTWSDVALSYSMWHLSFPSQDIFQSEFNFLEVYCVLGASPGTYYLNNEHVFSNITYSYQWDVSAILEGSDGSAEGIYTSVSVADGYYFNTSNGRRYLTNLLYFEGDVVYSSYEGFVSGWDGSINVLTPLFFDSSAEMLAFYSTFETSVSSSGGQYNAGFEKGKQAGLSEGREIGYSEGYDVGKAEGIEEGRNFTGSQNLGANLLGDTISAPFSALDQFVIYGSISLLDVLGACISLSLLIAFLKMFAGG